MMNEIKKALEGITGLSFRDHFTKGTERDESGISAVLDFNRGEPPKSTLQNTRVELSKINLECVCFLGEDDGSKQTELVALAASDILNVVDEMVPTESLHVDRGVFLNRLEKWRSTAGLDVIQISQQIFGFEISSLPEDSHQFCLELFEIWPTIFDPEDLVEVAGKLTLKENSYFEKWLRRDMVVEGFWD